MSKELQIQEWLNLKETVFTVADNSDKPKIASAKKMQLIRQLAPGLYTPDLTTNIDKLIMTHIWDIISAVYGTSIISRRSALFTGMAVDNAIEITAADNKKSITLGKYKITVISGPGPLEYDTLMAENIYIASEPRTILELAIQLAENTKLSKNKRAQMISEIHDWMNKKFDPSMVLQIEELNIKAKVLLHEHFYNYCKDVTGVIKQLTELLDFQPMQKPHKLTEEDLKFL